MPFDFPNYTYSGLLSLISALFGIAYPLINSSISEIDKKYHSTLLATRLKNESTVKAFRILLILNLSLAVMIPFLMYGSAYTYIYIIIQGVFTALMIASTFCLFHTISSYGDPNGLHQKIWDDYCRLLDSGKNKDEESRLFSQWTDIAKVLLSSNDLESAHSVYEGWYEYIGKFYQEHKSDETDFPLYFYERATRLNEAICQLPPMPISGNNGNNILTSLIILDKRVSDGTYSFLWGNLRIQLFYGKDDWIMTYWTQASQKYELFMQKVSEFEMNQDSGERYTQAEVEQRDRDRWLFLKFHIMFCAMVLRMEKYDLLGRILNFTQSQPPSYPLVPSTVAAVCSAFMKLHRDSHKDPLFLERMFPMPGVNGISDGKILGSAYEYLSLLMFRIYTLQLPYGARSAMSVPPIPIELGDLSVMKEEMEILLRWLGSTRKNKKLLGIVGIDDWNETLEWARSSYGEMISEPEEIINSLISGIKDQMKASKRDLPYDNRKVTNLLEEISDHITKGFKLYHKFLDIRNYSKETTYWVGGSTNQLYPNAAFVANPDINHCGIEDTVSEKMLWNFRHYFGSTFIRTRAEASYTIEGQEVFDCLDRLRLTDKQMIISFDIFWDYYLDRIPEFKKEDEANYTYRGVHILNLTSSQLMQRMFYVLNKDEIPYLTFKDPDEDYSNKFGLNRHGCSPHSIWLGLQKVKDHPDMLTEDDRKGMNEDPDEMSVLATYWGVKCHWKDNVHMVQVQVRHKLIDNGKVDDVNTVKSFTALLQEALAIRRKLSAANPATYELGLADTLNNLGNLHRNMNNYPQAAKEYDDALKICRRLAAADPATYEPDVAMTLNNLGNLHSDMNDYAKAAEEYAEALEIRKRLAAANPTTYEPDVANTLNNLGNLHIVMNDYPQAAEEYADALEIYRRLAAANPAAYEPNMAKTLGNIAILLAVQGHFAEAEGHAIESRDIYARCAERCHEAYDGDLKDAERLLAKIREGKDKADGTSES